MVLAPSARCGRSEPRLAFYVEQLGFEKNWHAGDGAGTVCQVSRSDCEIILCQDPARRDKARLFIELTADGLRDFRRELVERSVPTKAIWWGYDTTQVNDPDGNELLFPMGVARRPPGDAVRSNYGRLRAGNSTS